MCVCVSETPLPDPLLSPWQHPGNIKHPWVRHQLKDGTEYYFSLQTFEGTWERPQGCVLHPTHLSRDEIQVRKDVGAVLNTWPPGCIPKQLVAHSSWGLGAPVHC